MKIQSFVDGLQQVQNLYGKDVLYVDSLGKVKVDAWKAWGSRGEQVNRSNKETRQAFIDALKAQFQVDRVCRIPKFVLNELNLRDFKLDADDRVQSDKPLTARRISRVTSAVKDIDTLEKRTLRFTEIAKSALTDKCLSEYAALIRDGKLGTAKAFETFVRRWIGGETAKQLKAVMVDSPEDRKALCNAVADQMRDAFRQILIDRGVTAAQLSQLSRVIKDFSEQANTAETSPWRDLALSVAQKMEEANRDDAIAREAFDQRLGERLAKLKDISADELGGAEALPELMKTEHGRDVLLGAATRGLERHHALDAELRKLLDKALDNLAKNIRSIGADRAYILVHNLRYLMGGDEAGVNRTQVRGLLATVLGQYVNLTDADLKQISTARLHEYALAAVDDALVNDPAALKQKILDETALENAKMYTDADTQEMMACAEELGRVGPKAVRPAPENQPIEMQPVPDPNDKEALKRAEVLKGNKIVCANLELLGKLFHREDVWTSDTLGGAKAICDTLERNSGLVDTLVKNWPSEGKGGKDMSTFSLATSWVFKAIFKPELFQGNAFKVAFNIMKDMALANDFTNAINEINNAILAFSAATTQEEKMALCEKISNRVDKLATGLTDKLQDMLTEHLDALLRGDDAAGPFKDLKPGERPETADLLELAQKHFPAPKNETKAQRKKREAALLEEYGKLVLSPQAGGIGSLVRALAANYVKNLDVREKRSMLSGALMSLTPETLTDVLQGNSAIDLALKVPKGKIDEVKGLVAKKGEDGGLTEPQKALAGEIACGLIKGAGPVLQKMVQMVGAEKLPKFLRPVVKDCKSNLKPIPSAYVEAKLNEIARQSKGKIRCFRNPKSLGAASIAQAFACTLVDDKGNERPVVVKMLRPDVRGRMMREIAAIRSSVQEAGEGALRTLNARINSLMAELDFAEERDNIASLQPIYGKTVFTTLHSVQLAEDCPQLTDVLIMEKAPGVNVQKYMDETTDRLNTILNGRVKTDADGHYAFTAVSPQEQAQIKDELMQTYEDVRKRQANLQRLMQTWFSNALFGDGHFHGDLHGGNIMVDDNGDMTFIDFGNAPTFSAEDRKQVVTLVVAAMRGKSDTVLNAVKKLVSAESQTVLENKRADLRNKFDALFKIGDVMSNPAGRLTGIFGELSRAGVEIPAALYNFLEAFLRVQQLSDSMTSTLQRISGALPYMREHDSGVPIQLDFGNMKVEGMDVERDARLFRTLDQHIDAMLQERIRVMRSDSPGISDEEIFEKLKTSFDNGTFNRLFESYGDNNPIAGCVLPFGSHLLCKDVLYHQILGKMLGGPKLTSNLWAMDPQRRFFRDDEGNLDEGEYQEALADLSSQYKKTVLKNIDDFFGPYVKQDPALRPSVDELKALMTEAYATKNMGNDSVVLNLYSFRLEKNDLEKANKPGEPGKVPFSEEDCLDEVKKVPASSLLTDDKIAFIAQTNSKVKTLLYGMMPKLAEIYKGRMAQVMSGFDFSHFVPPVKMSDTLANSVRDHALTLVKLGGPHVIGLGISMLWKAKTDKTVEIRANFNVQLDAFRSYAKTGKGRFHATPAKTLEPTTSSMKALTVHNAEAWRAFAEALCADLHLPDAQFYKTPTGLKIMALLDLEEGQTLNDVEKASALTPEIIRRVLAVRDMDGLDTAEPSISAIRDYFEIASPLEDITFKQFGDALGKASSERLNMSLQKMLAAKFNMDEKTFNETFAVHYGKVIARMSEYGASDPYSAMTGKAPREEDVQRWMLAAMLSVFNEVVKPNPSVKLDHLFDKDLETRRNTLKSYGLRTYNPALTAMLLHETENPTGPEEQETREELDAFFKKACEYDSSIFRRVPDNNMIHQDKVDRGIKLGPKEIERQIAPGSKEERAVEAAREKMNERLEHLGYHVWRVAADEKLYAQFEQLKNEGKSVTEAFRAEVEKHVRREIYAGNGLSLDKDVEQADRVIAYWESRYLYAHPEQYREPAP